MRITLALVLSAIGCAHAVAQPMELRVSGLGRASCATWLADKASENEGMAWILGFWTGANALDPAGGTVGKSTDNLGIIAEVKRRCLEAPSEALVGVVSPMFVQFRDAGR
jgi:hypothetical protein